MFLSFLLATCQSKDGYYCVSVAGDDKNCPEDYKANVISFNQTQKEYSPDSQGFVHFAVVSGDSTEVADFYLDYFTSSISFLNGSRLRLNGKIKASNFIEIKAQDVHLYLGEDLEISSNVDILCDNSTIHLSTETLNKSKLLPESSTYKYTYETSDITDLYISPSQFKVNDYILNPKEFNWVAFQTESTVKMHFTGKKNDVFTSKLPDIILTSSSHLVEFDDTWPYLNLSMAASIPKGKIIFESNGVLSSQYVLYPREIFTIEGQYTGTVDGRIGSFCLYRSQQNKCPSQSRLIIWEPGKIIENRLIPTVNEKRNNIYVVDTNENEYPLIPVDGLDGQNVSFFGSDDKTQYIHYDASGTVPKEMHLTNIVVNFSEPKIPEYTFTALSLIEYSQLILSGNLTYVLNIPKIIATTESVIKMAENKKHRIYVDYLEVCISELELALNYIDDTDLHIDILESDHLSSINLGKDYVEISYKHSDQIKSLRIVSSTYSKFTIDAFSPATVLTVDSDITTIEKPPQFIVRGDQSATLILDKTWNTFKGTQEKAIKIESPAYVKVLTEIDVPSIFVLPNNTRVIKALPNQICLYADDSQITECPDSTTKYNYVRTHKLSHSISVGGPVSIYSFADPDEGEVTIPEITIDFYDNQDLNVYGHGARIYLNKVVPFNNIIVNQTQVTIVGNFTANMLTASKDASFVVENGEGEVFIQHVYYSSIKAVQVSESLKAQIFVIMDHKGPEQMTIGKNGVVFTGYDKETFTIPYSAAFFLGVQLDRRASESSPFILSTTKNIEEIPLLPYITEVGDGTKFIKFDHTWDQQEKPIVAGKQGIIKIDSSTVIESAYETIPNVFTIEATAVYDLQVNTNGRYCLYQNDDSKSLCPSDTKQIKVQYTNNSVHYNLEMDTIKESDRIDVYLADTDKDDYPSLLSYHNIHIYSLTSEAYCELSGFYDVIYSEGVNILTDDFSCSVLEIYGAAVISNDFVNVGDLRTDPESFAKDGSSFGSLNFVTLRMGSGTIAIGDSKVIANGQTLSDFYKIQFNIAASSLVHVDFINETGLFTQYPIINCLYNQDATKATIISFTNEWTKVKCLGQTIKVIAEKGADVRVNIENDEFPSCIAIDEAIVKNYTMNPNYLCYTQKSFCPPEFSTQYYNNETEAIVINEPDADLHIVIEDSTPDLMPVFSSITAKSVLFLSNRFNHNEQNYLIINNLNVTETVNFTNLILNKSKMSFNVDTLSFDINTFTSMRSLESVNNLYITGDISTISISSSDFLVNNLHSVSFQGKKNISFDTTKDLTISYYLQKESDEAKVSFIPSIIKAPNILISSSWLDYNPSCDINGTSKLVVKQPSVPPEERNETNKGKLHSEYSTLPSFFEVDGFLTYFTKSNIYCVYLDDDSNKCDPNTIRSVKFDNTSKPLIIRESPNTQGQAVYVYIDTTIDGSASTPSTSQLEVVLDVYSPNVHIISPYRSVLLNQFDSIYSLTVDVNPTIKFIATEPKQTARISTISIIHGTILFGTNEQLPAPSQEPKTSSSNKYHIIPMLSEDYVIKVKDLACPLDVLNDNLQVLDSSDTSNSSLSITSNEANNVLTLSSIKLPTINGVDIPTIFSNVFIKLKGYLDIKASETNSQIKTSIPEVIAIDNLVVRPQSSIYSSTFAEGRTLSLSKSSKDYSLSIISPYDFVPSFISYQESDVTLYLGDEPYSGIIPGPSPIPTPSPVPTASPQPTSTPSPTESHSDSSSESSSESSESYTETANADSTVISVSELNQKNIISLVLIIVCAILFILLIIFIVLFCVQRTKKTIKSRDELSQALIGNVQGEQII